MNKRTFLPDSEFKIYQIKPFEKRDIFSYIFNQKMVKFYLVVILCLLKVFLIFIENCIPTLKKILFFIVLYMKLNFLFTHYMNVLCRSVQYFQILFQSAKPA